MKVKIHNLSINHIDSTNRGRFGYYQFGYFCEGYFQFGMMHDGVNRKAFTGRDWDVVSENEMLKIWTSPILQTKL